MSAKSSIFCPKCFSKTQIARKQSALPIWTRWRCIECGMKFSVLGRDIPWPPGDGAAAQQRDTALKFLRQLGVTVQEISEIVDLSEDYVNQVTKVPIQ